MRRKWNLEKSDPEKWWGLRIQCVLIRNGNERAVRLTNLRSTPVLDLKVSVSGTIFDEDSRVDYFNHKPSMAPKVEAFASLDIDQHDGFVTGASYRVDCEYLDIDGRSFYECFHFHIDERFSKKICSLPWSYLHIFAQFGNKVGFTVWNPEDKTPSDSATTAIDMSWILVLGPDTGRYLEKLRQIQDAIFLLGYNSALVRDQKEFGHETIEQKLIRIAMSTRFVLVEDSIAAGHIDELSLLSRSRAIVAVLREHGKAGTWMQSDYDLDFPIQFFTYRTDLLNDLSQTVTRAVDWAESKLRNRTEVLGKRYPWRHSIKPSA
jgi:hypothetical protein